MYKAAEVTSVVSFEFHATSLLLPAAYVSLFLQETSQLHTL